MLQWEYEIFYYFVLKPFAKLRVMIISKNINKETHFKFVVKHILLIIL